MIEADFVCLDIRDNSGIRMVYTSNLREIEGGIMNVGHVVSGFYMAIPPNLEKFNSRGNCGSRCLGGVSYHDLHI